MTKEEFRNEIIKIGMFADELSYAADVSIQTAQKWLDGASAPHEYMRENVIIRLKQDLRGEVERENGWTRP